MKRFSCIALIICAALCGLLLSCASARMTSTSEPAPATKESGVLKPVTTPAPGAPAKKEEAPPAEKEAVAPETAARSADKTKAADDTLGFMTETAPKPRSDSPAPAPTSGTRGAAASPTPSVSGLSAGFADDNKQFNYFVNFLSEYSGTVPFFPISVQERIVLKVTDQAGKSVPNAAVTVSGGGKKLAEGVTYADGTFLFFPSEYDASLTGYTAKVSAAKAEKETAIQRGGPRQIAVRLQAPRPSYANVPLDILFILDTTGSMGEEIDRLKATIEIINMNLGSLSSKPALRFGLVLYRDRGEEEYVTQVVPLTADLSKFQRDLDAVEADGGGDDPEDLQKALEDSMKRIAWNPQGIRLAFIVTDAPPHLDYTDQAYTYVEAVKDARSRGIKVFSVGTGGLDLAGELVLRQISQYTYAKYIFLTYGEEGESEGGAPGSVSHHTGANYQTDKLEAIIIRLAKEEIAFLTDQPLEEEGDFFQAVKIPTEEKDQTLAKLFDMAIAQIIDYASIKLPAGVPTGALPVVAQAETGKLNAEYFSEQLVLSLARNKTFAAVERKDMQKILKELELQMSGITEEANAAKVGKVLGAQMLLTGTLFDRKDTYEIFLKLLRVETGEILSVTKLVVDKKLGL